MKIQIVDSYEKISIVAKDLIMGEVIKNPRLLLCAATGGSPTGTYALLGKEYIEHPELFSELRIAKLDEWEGVPLENPATCESYLQKHLISPLKIPKHRYISFNSASGNPEDECQRVHERLKAEGRIDLCILGLGMNGHLAFNEPAQFLHPHCHIARLSSISQQHEMASGFTEKPAFGLTLGMVDIMRSKKILLLIHGSHKKDIVNRLLKKQISTAIPASFLWLHQQVTCIIENSALSKPAYNSILNSHAELGGFSHQ